MKLKKPAGKFAQIEFKGIGYKAKAKIMQTPFQRMMGLMFKRKVTEPLLFVFPTVNRHANSIHAFFCPYFDAAYLSEDGVVIDYFQNVAPYTALIVPTEDPAMLVEAPPNSLSGLKKGDRFTLRL